MLPFPVQRNITAGFGYSQWGSVPWGDEVSPVRAVPWEITVPVPDFTGEHVTAGWIHAVSQEPFAISQVAFLYDQLAEYEVTS
jgi:hypothetical protein